MKKPDFIIGGSTRSGITALSHILDSHPQIFIPHLREHRFFFQSSLTKNIILTCKDDFDKATNRNLQKQFTRSSILFGEKEYDAERAANGCPDAKVIFTLRDPVERACRQYSNARAHGKEKARTFEQAMSEELSGKRSPEAGDKCWLYKNQYETHIKKWVSRFPRKNIFIMIYEEWTKPGQNGLQPLEEFLGLEVSSLIGTQGKNTNAKEHITNLRDRKPPKYTPPTGKIKEQLEDFFATDKTYISTLLNRKIPYWDTL